MKAARQQLDALAGRHPRFHHLWRGISEVLVTHRCIHDARVLEVVNVGK